MPLAPRVSARSVRRPSRPITVATRTISSVVRSRVWARLLNALPSWPTIPRLRVSSRTPTSPRAAARSASSSGCRSAAETTAPSPFALGERAAVRAARCLVCVATEPSFLDMFFGRDVAAGGRPEAGEF